MVKGLTMIKVLLPLLLLLSACSEQPASNETDKKSQKLASQQASITENKVAEKPKDDAPKAEKILITATPANSLPLEQVAEESNANNTASPPVKSESTQPQKEIVLDYSDRKIEVLDISERSFDGGNAIAVTLSAPLNPELNHDDYFSLTERSGAKVDDSIISVSYTHLTLPTIYSV